MNQPPFPPSACPQALPVLLLPQLFVPVPRPLAPQHLDVSPLSRSKTLNALFALPHLIDLFNAPLTLLLVLVIILRLKSLIRFVVLPSI